MINDYTTPTSISSSEKAEINHEVRKLSHNKENEGLFDNVQTKTVIPTTAPTTLRFACITSVSRVIEGQRHGHFDR